MTARNLISSVVVAGFSFFVAVTPSTAQVALVSVNAGGTSTANGSSGLDATGLDDDHLVSADGRFILFETIAGDLGPTDTNGTRDVYLRDRQTDTTTLERIS